jgi:hypothetical protein
MQMDHDGGSLSLCLFSQFRCQVWQWPGFHSQTDVFITAMSRQINQLNNQPTNQTHFLHYFNIQDFHKVDSCWVVKTLYLHLQNVTVHQHSHKTLHSTHISSQVNTTHSLKSICIIPNYYHLHLSIISQQVNSFIFLTEMCQQFSTSLHKQLSAHFPVFCFMMISSMRLHIM